VPSMVRTWGSSSTTRMWLIPLSNL